ncbi:hypothetical protein M422DRAFT_784955 [Sphaerobolus stellatus SS14]|uniref:Uncharacterized protein n=1 Tax=Sphaerobolus stellatus (strain SS14) TaxID=990650 RepID=A0A0C9UPI0_SPHS4|nr:hypothetical protein M422DRAFT_784955 [Sphaerobolus stellatus SS14]
MVSSVQIEDRHIPQPQTLVATSVQKYNIIKVSYKRFLDDQLCAVCVYPETPKAHENLGKCLSYCQRENLDMETLIHGYRFSRHSLLYWTLWETPSKHTADILSNLLKVPLNAEVRKDAYVACIEPERCSMDFESLRLAPGAESYMARQAHEVYKRHLPRDYVTIAPRLGNNFFEFDWIIPEFEKRMKLGVDKHGMGIEFVASGIVWLLALTPPPKKLQEERNAKSGEMEGYNTKGSFAVTLVPVEPSYDLPTFTARVIISPGCHPPRGSAFRRGPLGRICNRSRVDNATAKIETVGFDMKTFSGVKIEALHDAEKLADVLDPNQLENFTGILSYSGLHGVTDMASFVNGKRKLVVSVRVDLDH